MNQAVFAVTVAKCAVNTVARWETTHPPRGETLLQLSDVARQQNLFELADLFRLLYVDQVRESLKFDLLMAPKTGTKPAHGYLMLDLVGSAELRAAQSFNIVVKALRSSDPEIKKIASAAFSALRAAARQVNKNPAIEEIQDAFRAALSGDSGESEEQS